MVIIIKNGNGDGNGNGIGNHIVIALAMEISIVVMAKLAIVIRTIVSIIVFYIEINNISHASRNQKHRMTNKYNQIKWYTYTSRNHNTNTHRHTKGNATTHGGYK